MSCPDSAPSPISFDGSRVTVHWPLGREEACADRQRHGPAGAGPPLLPGVETHVAPAAQRYLQRERADPLVAGRAATQFCIADAFLRPPSIFRDRLSCEGTVRFATERGCDQLVTARSGPWRRGPLLVPFTPQSV